MALKEVDLCTTERGLDRDLTRTLNFMAHRISMAYSIELKALKIDAGAITKMLVEPVVNPPASVHDDLSDVWRNNRVLDFGAFEKASYGGRCSMLLQLLQDGLLVICNRLSLDVAPFEAIHAELMAANFVYRYKNGKPVVHKNGRVQLRRRRALRRCIRTGEARDRARVPSPRPPEGRPRSRHAARAGRLPGAVREAVLGRGARSSAPTRTVFLNLRGSAATQNEYGFFVADFPFKVIQ